MKRAWLVVLAGWMAAGCGAKPERAKGEKPPAAATPVASDPAEIAVEGTLAGWVKVAQVKRQMVGIPLTVSARLEVDATRVTRIGTPVMGRVVSALVEEGQVVRRGEHLAQLQSTGLNEAQLELLKSLSQQMVTQRAVERARLLLKADVIGSAELQRREAELSQADAEVEAARDELQLLGFSEPEVNELEKTRAIRSTARIVATMDGTILHRRVTVGQVVQPADTAFEIADLSNLWIVADVPEQEAGVVRAGQAVTAEVGAYAGEPISGTLAFVSQLVNPETRTVVVRMNLPNSGRRYKPAMLATLTLEGHPQERLVVPEAAMVREGDQQFVFVKRPSGRFALTEVKAGVSRGGRQVILEGLRGGEEVVVEGAFHLNNERRRRNVRGNE